MTKRIWDRYKTLPVQVKASFWFLICSFLQKGISVITTPIFTRLLTTGEYGEVNVFNSWLSIVTIFVSLNLYAGVYTQGLVKYADDRKAYSSSLQGLTLVLVLAWSIVYFIFREFWNNLFSLTTMQMLAMLLMIWTSAVFNFWASEQRVQFKYKALIAITLGVSLAKPLLSIFLITYSKDKVTARILGLAIVELFGYTWLFFLQMACGKKFYSSKYWKQALSFNIPLIPHYLSQTVLNNSDRIMIQNMVGSSEAGIYSLAYSISQIMTLFNTALLQTVNPWIYQKIKEKRVEDISKVAYSSLLVIAFVNIVLIAVAPEIVSIFAPNSYYEAIWVIPPVAMSTYFLFAYSLFADFSFYYEKTKMIACTTTVGAVLNILLNYIFIQIFGYYAAGYTTLVCYILYAVFHYMNMRKICRDYMKGVKVYNLKTLFFITVVFLTIGFIFLVIYPYQFVRYGLICLSCILIFLNRLKIMNKIKKYRDIKK